MIATSASDNPRLPDHVELITGHEVQLAQFFGRGVAIDAKVTIIRLMDRCERLSSQSRLPVQAVQPSTVYQPREGIMFSISIAVRRINAIR
jgi:hypothetical protein